MKTRNCDVCTNINCTCWCVKIEKDSWIWLDIHCLKLYAKWNYPIEKIQDFGCFKFEIFIENEGYEDEYTDFDDDYELLTVVSKFSELKAFAETNSDNLDIFVVSMTFIDDYCRYSDSLKPLNLPKLLKRCHKFYSWYSANAYNLAPFIVKQSVRKLLVKRISEVMEPRLKRRRFLNQSLGIDNCQAAVYYVLWAFRGVLKKDVTEYLARIIWGSRREAIWKL